MPGVPVAALRVRTCLVELGHEPSGLLDTPLGLRGACLGAAAQPLDLTPDGIGERFLVGGLPAQEVVATGEELAVASRRVWKRPSG